MLTAEKRQALAVCLLIAIAVIGTYFVILDKSQFFQYSSASLIFTLNNQTNRTLDLSFFLHIGNGGVFNFNGSGTSKLHGNFSVYVISDGSGVEVDFNDLAPSGYLSFETQQIKVTPLLRGLGDTEINLSFPFGNLSDFAYDGVISLLNDQGISVGSRYCYTVRLSQNESEPRYEDRTSSLYLNALIAVVTVLLIGMVAMIAWHRARWFPIITLSIVFVTLFLYVFVGSGNEIFEGNWSRLFVPLSVFIHGYDWHIFGNLVFFTIVSVPFESFLRMKDQWMKMSMFWWYFLPLYIVPVLVATLLGGFGLSLSIEIMTWSLWAYLVSNYKELITNRIRTFMAVLAGIPSYTFVSWVVPFLFGSYNNDPYNASEALLHIVFGIVSAVGVLLVVVYLTRNKTETKEGDFQI
jgi:hypothetical protein